MYKAPVLVLRGLWYKHINVVDIKRKTYERNDVETIIDSDRILQLYGERIEEGLNHKNFWVTTTKCLPSHREHI